MKKRMMRHIKFLVIICFFCFSLFVSSHVKAALVQCSGPRDYQAHVVKVTEDSSAIVEILSVRAMRWVDFPKGIMAKIPSHLHGIELKKGDKILFVGYVYNLTRGHDAKAYKEIYEDTKVECIGVFEEVSIDPQSPFNFIVKAINSRWYLFYPNTEEKKLRIPLKNIKDYNTNYLGLKYDVKLKTVETYHLITLDSPQTKYVVGSYKDYYAIINPENISYLFNFEKNPLSTENEIHEYILLRENMKMLPRSIIYTKRELDKLLISMAKTHKEAVSRYPDSELWEYFPKDNILLKEQPVNKFKIVAAADAFFVEILFLDTYGHGVRKICYEKYKLDKDGTLTLIESEDIAVGVSWKTFIRY